MLPKALAYCLKLFAAEFDLTMAMGATSALLSYLSLLTDSSNYGQYKLRRHTLAQFMKLDASALKAPTLMPSPEVVPLLTDTYHTLISPLF